MNIPTSEMPLDRQMLVIEKAIERLRRQRYALALRLQQQRAQDALLADLHASVSRMVLTDA